MLIFKKYSFIVCSLLLSENFDIMLDFSFSSPSIAILFSTSPD